MVLLKRFDFWFIFTFLSCAAAFFSYTYIDKVYSLVNLSITANRHQVLADAQKLAQELSWDITDYQDVTSFESQDDLQCFVELEAGGKDAFVEMFESGTYYPYHWHVRFFKEKQVIEMHAWFSPQGQRIGYAQKLSEQSAGAALDKEQAQSLIQEQITAWCTDFDRYKLIEYDRQVRTTGRVDHTCTYERTDKTIGAGFYRFKAVVCGDVVTKLEPFVKIPDNFLRRYKQMRSANNLLGSVGSFFFRSLYLLFFCLLGFILFYRRNYLLYKNSAIAAGIVAGGMFLRGLNEFPLWATSYNTVQSSSTFIIMKLIEQFITFFSLFAMIFLTLVVAEAAGRWMYGKHIQFFKNFSLSAFSCVQVAEQVIFGYLMVPFMFAYVVVFGYVTKTYGGWWSPAGSLFDPNVVACYFPWLSAVTISLQAGFFEEVVCRAIPLAMTAFLTKDSKYKNIWFFAIFIVQALIFGACHANYPNQPFYARLIELIIPSFGFGWMYLTFGLLPGVITHFVYDVIWFAMPIFSSNLVLSQCMVILLAGLPLWTVLFLYVYNRKFTRLSVTDFNEACPKFQVKNFTSLPRPIGQEIPALHIKIIIVCGLLGLLTWVGTYKFHSDVRPLGITKAQAIARAEQEVQHQFHDLIDSSWTAVATTQDDCSDMASRFIWQVYGKEIYDLAMDSYLYGITWKVRFIQFSRSVEDRCEEYIVKMTTDYQGHAHVVYTEHIVPEHFAGADLTQEQALQIAYDFIEKKYLLMPQDLSVVLINNDKFDNRRDWTIIMQDTNIFDFALEGQARITIKLCGDEICAYSRFIFVPEKWVRKEQASIMNLNSIKIGCYMLLFFFIAFGLLLGMQTIFTSRFGVHIMRHKALFIAMVGVIHACNSLPELIGYFNTAEPLYHQLTGVWLGLISKMSYQVLSCSLLLALGAVGCIKGKRKHYIHSLIIGVSAGLFMIGVNSLIIYIMPQMQPLCGGCQSISHYFSVLAFVGHYFKIFYIFLSAMIAIFFVMKALRHVWADRIWMHIIPVILFCISLQAIFYVDSVFAMIVSGVSMGLTLSIIFYLILQYDMTLLPIVCGMDVISMIVPSILYPAYVGARIDGLIALVFIAMVAVYFYERAHQE